MSLFVFCGKGGVGKSTLASAFALKLSKSSLRTLILSIDPAHSLSDIFSREIGNRLTELENNLHAVEVDAFEEAERYLKDARRMLESLLDRRSLSAFERYAKLTISSTSALNTAYIKALSRYLRMDYEAFVLDTPPTGNFLHFLKHLFHLEDMLRFIIDVKQKEYDLRKNWKGEDPKEEILSRLQENLEDTLFVKQAFVQATYFLIVSDSKLSYNEAIKLYSELSSLKVRSLHFILNGTDKVEPPSTYMYVPHMDQLNLYKLSQYIPMDNLS